MDKRETLASRLIYVNVKHSCASHSPYFILFVLYFELISCEIDKIYNRKKVLLIYNVTQRVHFNV